jgi:hypothetical protein
MDLGKGEEAVGMGSTESPLPRRSRKISESSERRIQTPFVDGKISDRPAFTKRNESAPYKQRAGDGRHRWAHIYRKRKTGLL